MWPRLSIVAGLLTGIAAAALVLGGILLFGPAAGAVPTLAPQPPASFALDPSPTVSPTPSPSLSPSASPSSSASTPASPSASASASASADPNALPSTSPSVSTAAVEP